MRLLHNRADPNLLIKNHAKPGWQPVVSRRRTESAEAPPERKVDRSYRAICEAGATPPGRDASTCSRALQRGGAAHSTASSIAPRAGLWVQSLSVPSSAITILLYLLGYVFLLIVALIVVNVVLTRRTREEREAERRRRRRVPQ
jgi:hypothetical protein